MAALVYPRLTHAQARLVDEALGVFEAVHNPDDDPGYDAGLMRRTREKIQTAMAEAGVAP